MRRNAADILILGISIGLALLAAQAVAHAAFLGTNVNVVVVPNDPSNLTATANAPTQVGLSWTDNANQPGEVASIERSLDDVTFAQIATVPGGIATYADNGVAAATLYYYRVRILYGGAYSGYSNEASTTTPAAPIPPSGGGGSGGGGGGGGGGANYYEPSPFRTSAIFKGIAYPMSTVTLLQNGQVVAATQAGPDANFEIDLSGLVPGTYNFGVWAADPNGSRSVTQTFQITVTEGATTVISGIFFPPTISADKIKVKKGDVITMLGYTAPQALVTVIVHSSKEVVSEVTASDTGAWAYGLNTDLLAAGDHTAAAHSATGTEVTNDSALVSFTVGDENVATPPPSEPVGEADLSGDNRVNLVDFSIMAYWYRRPDPPAAIDLNGDGTINLTDFSILAYYWTG